MWKLLSQSVRRDSFNFVHDLIGSQKRFGLQEQMHMIQICFNGNHLTPDFRYGYWNQLQQTLVHLANQHLSASSDNLDKMIVNQANRGAFMPIFLSHSLQWNVYSHDLIDTGGKHLMLKPKKLMGIQ